MSSGVSPTPASSDNTTKLATTAFVQTGVQTTDNSLATHVPDYLKHTGYVAATGSVNTYIATLSPMLTAYKEGISLRVKINISNTGASTVNVNGLGAKCIKNSKGAVLETDELVAGSIYTLFYDGTASFILQGEGGDTPINGEVIVDALLEGNITMNDRVIMEPIEYDNPLVLTLTSVNGTPNSYSFSPDNKLLAVRNNTSPFLFIYRVEGDKYTKLPNISPMPTVGSSTGGNAIFSDDGKFFMVTNGEDRTNMGAPLLYAADGETFTNLPQSNTVPSRGSVFVAITCDNNYVPIALDDSPYILIYKRSGNTLTKLANPSGLPASGSWQVAFSPSGLFLAVSWFADGTSASALVVYKRNVDTFTKLANFSTMPPIGRPSYTLAFSPDGKFLLIGGAYNDPTTCE
ncbi:WD40 repeat domain-containing protein [Psychrobacillus glaciei]|uniref:WD40 repeat domain-containing protein n=1 Tax=Psychrobacillus glaciei TaxID=2283160 RepID=A0A5J6SLV0_9BACI|nr:WD40 repeat domain-containing protein [Psychrobacillus glaciei]QFF98901.1 WD40 repeat domain-containing protein [Psychrobacillus glaciei]